MIRDEIKKILNIPEAEIERPAKENFGDYSTNAALKLAKEQKRNPKEVAKEIISKINPVKAGQKSNLFEKIEVAAPGFINFFLAKEYLQKQVGEILRQKEQYITLNIGQGKKVQVEFISANPTGPLTLGNARGGFLGDVLASVLQKAGFNVQREFYINDTGEQVIKLGHSILGDKEAVYRGKYINDLKKKISIQNKPVKEIGQEAAKIIVEELIKPVIAKKMKIKFDNWFSESILHEQGKIQEVINIFKEKDLVYEKDGALWFKSSQYGDDKDRVLIKRDGQPTYLAADAAYHLNKFRDRGFDKVTNIWGADHHGDVARIRAAVEVLGFGGQLEIILFQFVHLMESGKEIRMSKRSGTYVTVEELIDEVGLDVARFFFLMYSPNSHMDFDLDLAKEQSEKNPIYYIQYAYARIHSILKKAGIAHESGRLDADYRLLIHPAELDLIKQLVSLPEIIEDIAKDYQVQRLPQYALDLVTAFHKFYEECRVISGDKNLTQARLALVEATRIVLKNTLDLMGISAPEKM